MLRLWTAWTPTASEHKGLEEVLRIKSRIGLREVQLFLPISKTENDLGQRNSINVSKSAERRMEVMKQKSDLEESFFILLEAKIVELSDFVKAK